MLLIIFGHDLECHNIQHGGYIEIKEKTDPNNLKHDDLIEHHPIKKCEKCGRELVS